MSPLEFVQRLAALVPRPRLHLARSRAAPVLNTRLPAQVAPQGLAEQRTESATAAECETEVANAMAGRIILARLLERALDIDMQQCPNCGAGERRIQGTQGRLELRSSLARIRSSAFGR